MDPHTLHFDSIVIDAHCDTLGDVLEGKRTLTERSATGHVDLPRLREGGVTAQLFACFVPVEEYHRSATRHAMQRLDMLHLAVESHPDEILLATGAADIRRIPIPPLPETSHDYRYRPVPPRLRLCPVDDRSRCLAGRR